MIFNKRKLDVKSRSNPQQILIDSQNVNQKDYVLIVKQNGKFCYVYDTDALIFNYIFDYKIISGLRCGFPNNSLEKVLNKLEELKISYQVKYLDKIISTKQFKNLNDYTRISILARKTALLKNRLDILMKTIKTSNKEILERVIESIEECLRL